MPTVRRCCIVGCMSNSRLNPNLQFFQFPRPENPFYKLWTQACQASLSRILPFKKPVLCASHFHPHCIGGRRLTSSAVPTLKLEVPTNLKAVEQQAMVEEIERSRKCAYINAVVYEWLVRANLNPQLRGSITHGMIKEKAETAKQMIGCDTFAADNRWLNRFRESHLAGFAQKLASNQLKPMGPSLWIPDIVQDLQHLFPPTSAERIENFENVPEQYINYMKQYGEYEDDDETEQEQSPNGAYTDQDSVYAEQKMSNQAYYQQHAGQNYYQQPPTQHHQSPPPPPPHVNGYNPYGHHGGGLHHPASGYNAYHDYYNNDRHQPPHYQPPHHNGAYAGQQPSHHHQPSPPQPPSRPMSHSPPQQHQQQHLQPQQQPIRPMSHSPPQIRTSPIDPLQINRTSSPAAVNGNKRPHANDESDNNNLPSSKRSSPILNGPPTPHQTPSPTPQPIEATESNNNDSFKIKLPLINGSSLGASTTAPSSPSNVTNSNSRSSSPKSQTDKGATTNGRNSTASPTPSSSADTNTKELETYAQALEYLKPLEDFALFKENFRAIGLISQLENILKKCTRPAVKKVTNGNT